MKDLVWLIPLLPFVGALLNGVLLKGRINKKAVAGIACAVTGIAAALAIGIILDYTGDPRYAGGQPFEEDYYVWMPAGPIDTVVGGVRDFNVPFGFLIDPLSCVMMFVVTFVGFLIHLYSVGYMSHEEGFQRYFAYLNLFMGAMLLLVLGNSYAVMFVGWEGVGLCSYLLIGFYFKEEFPPYAGRKAFIVNRIGDFAFVVGLFALISTFGTVKYTELFPAIAANRPLMEGASWIGLSLAGFVALCLFIGACGKSAQIPLYVWLPDAMAGPTPVSALIHAATMVTAGVYMVGRNAVLFSHAPMTMEVVAVVGVLTALMAASIGLVQTDIKRVLAYSTVSQLGFMFLAMGVGAFAAGAFHLMTHAFFKALLFLCSGAVIHGMAGEQNMLKMGGLRKHMPLTFATMMIGTLAIAGIPPLSGFFSKDEILYRAFLSSRLLWGLAAFAALMTAFYMFRLMSLTFFGAYRGRSWELAGPRAVAEAGAHGVVHPGDPFAHGAAHRPDHEVSHGPADAATTGHAGHADDDAHGHGAWHGPHEAPRPMTFVLATLAVGAVLAGFVGVPAALGGGNAIEHFLEPSFAAHTAGSHAAQSDASGVLPTTGGDDHAAAQAGMTGEEGGHGEVTHLSRGAELALMAISVVIGVIGILVAWRVYVRRPEISTRLAAQFAGPHRVLTNKYYVDELYDATVIRGTMGGANGLWAFDRQVVDGAVNGSGWMTIISSWLSHLVDKYLVDGLVNLVGSGFRESSFVFRRVQTGLIQNYALLMLVGVFAFVSLYLLVR